MEERITEQDAIVWQDGRWWLGHLRQHPDYWTQGKDLEDLREHLRDLQADITSRSVSGVGARRDE